MRARNLPEQLLCHVDRHVRFRRDRGRHRSLDARRRSVVVERRRREPHRRKRRPRRNPGSNRKRPPEHPARDHGYKYNGVEPAGTAPYGNGGPFVGPYHAAAQGDGTGTMTVSPDSVAASSTGNTFTFTYTASGSGLGNNSVLTLQVPAGWTAPQSTTSTSAG